ncbi:MAG TPA: hypothetical protein PKA19_13130, partial [Bacillota bacterium]|nr:hypothetical protein [Bacillota bacterium]
ATPGAGGYDRGGRNPGWSQTGGNDGYSGSEIFRPFEQLKYIKQSQAASGVKGAGSDLKNGDKVCHNKFGEGLVLSVDGSTVTIAFDSVGVKKLAKDIAPIKKI